jgi:hypothetical protein
MSSPSSFLGGAFIHLQARSALIRIAPTLPRPKDRKNGEYDSDANDGVANRYLIGITVLNASILKCEPKKQEQGTYREEHRLNRVRKHWYLRWFR